MAEKTSYSLVTCTCNANCLACTHVCLCMPDEGYQNPNTHKRKRINEHYVLEGDGIARGSSLPKIDTDVR